MYEEPVVSLDIEHSVLEILFIANYLNMKLNLHGGSLIWLRRDLRIMENDLVKNALLKGKKIVFCFVFDYVILSSIKSSPFRILDSKSLHVDKRLR